tara:strand:- start:71209 stop:72234 length:1026 start_codon:yes stop_codon:yes gene_type:complete
MIVDKKDFEVAIAQESIEVLIGRKLYQEAIHIYIDNREILSEKQGWLAKMFGGLGPGGYPEESELDTPEEFEALEGVLGLVARELEKMPTAPGGGTPQYTKKQALRVANQFLTGQGDLNLSPTELKDISTWLRRLPGQQLAKMLNVASEEEDKGLGDTPDRRSKWAPPETGETAQGADPEPGETDQEKPATVRDTVVDLQRVLNVPVQRQFLLRGLINLITQDRVESALKMVRPQQAQMAVLNLIQTLAKMEPKEYETLKNDLEDSLTTKMMSDDKPSRTKRAGAGIAGPERWEKERVGRQASKAVGSKLSGLGLNESKKNIKQQLLVLELISKCKKLKLI